MIANNKGQVKMVRADVISLQMYTIITYYFLLNVFHGSFKVAYILLVLPMVLREMHPQTFSLEFLSKVE